MTWRKRAMSGECKGRVALYRFFNFVVGKHGEPFTLCEEHRAQQVVPDNCFLEKMADSSVYECEMEGARSGLQ